MLSVPKLEDQRAQHEFKYDNIRVMLTYQTQFDASVKACTVPKIADLFPVEALTEFPKMTLD